MPAPRDIKLGAFKRLVKCFSTLEEFEAEAESLRAEALATPAKGLRRVWCKFMVLRTQLDRKKHRQLGRARAAA